MRARGRTRASPWGLLSGLLLSACGGAPEPGLALDEVPLGTWQSALCSGASVTSLTILGVSSYGGEAAGSGDWTVSSPANAVRLEYYVDGTLSSSEERTGASGSWYFSQQNTSCGSHTFLVKAFPMVIDSNGNRTTCWSTFQSDSEPFTQSCPSASLSCSQGPYSVNCTGSASGGSGPYTYLWREHWRATNGSGSWSSSWFESSTSRNFLCIRSYTFPANWEYYEFKVRDSTGMESPVSVSPDFLCQP